MEVAKSLLCLAWLFLWPWFVSGVGVALMLAVFWVCDRFSRW